MAVFIGAGAHACVVFEDAAEVQRVVVSDRLGNLRDGVIRLVEQAHRVGDAQRYDILHGCEFGDAAEVLRLRNYDGLTLDEAGERLMVSRERIRQLEQKGIRKLREPKIACTLRPFMIFDFYSSTGLSAYRQSGMSIQERYVAMEEEHREREWQRMKAEEERTQEALANAERFLAKYRHEQRANRE